MISAVAAAGPVKVAAVLASVLAAAAVGEGETAAEVDVVSNAKHTQITLIWVNALICLALPRWRLRWPQKKGPEIPGDHHELNHQQCIYSEYEL